MSGKRCIRKRRALDELEEASEDEAAPSVEDTKLLQRERQRRVGMGASSLALADKKAARASEGSQRAGDVLTAAFNREKRAATADEDPHMKKYVEEQLAKRLGRAPRNSGGAEPSGRGRGGGGEGSDDDSDDDPLLQGIGVQVRESPRGGHRAWAELGGRHCGGASRHGAPPAGHRSDRGCQEEAT